MHCRQIKQRLTTLAAVLLLMGWPLAGLGLAKVGGPCVNCHTIHNSQGGETVVDSRLPGLLSATCVNCHTGTNAGGATPYVLTTAGGGPTYGDTGTTGNTLAGGNFYWLASGAAKGHNVSGITVADGVHGLTPPGGTALAAQLTCAGSTGCHGDRTVDDEAQSLGKGHHRNDMSQFKDGSTTPKSFRFLKGIQGLEDSQFEYQPTAAGHHNKYSGMDRTADSDGATATISGFCAVCHGDFHSDTNDAGAGSYGNGVWLRHPINFDMSNAVSSSEYTTYNGGIGANNPYSVISPVATASTTATLNTTVYSINDDAIVMCLSCHRAHGSPHDDILRWDYKGWPGPGSYNGCAICHTSKD